MKRMMTVLLALTLCLACTCSVSACPVLYPIRSVSPVGSAVEIVDEDTDSVTIRKTDGNDPFKILLFTDLHLSGSGKKHTRTLSCMVENIQREKPDLVLLGGDNVTGAFTRYRAHQLARTFEKLGVYWGGVIGNHEGDNVWSVRRDTMVSIFSSYDHCLMRMGQGDVDGVCNYRIRILNADGKTLRQVFYCLDTFDGMSETMKKEHGFGDKKFVTDVIKPSQIAWYSAALAADKALYGSVPSCLLIHVPLTQFALAAQDVEDGKDAFLYGVHCDGICCEGFDSGMFAAVKASGSTSAVLCGHDHKNNFGIRYDGVLLHYIEPSGYGVYGMDEDGAPESEWLQGYTRMLLDPDGAYTLTQVRNAALDAA